MNSSACLPPLGHAEDRVRSTDGDPGTPVSDDDLAVELSALKSRWQGEGNPDAAAYLAVHPHLAERRGVVLELAYEDFCQRRQAGERVDVEAFCARFPTFRSDVRRLIEVRSEMERRLRQLDEAVPARWPRPGDTVQGFVLQDEIGRGGFGRVFLASEPALGNRTVVVKLSPQGDDEARTLGPLTHPNIVSVHAAQQDPGSGLTVVCMPYQGRATLDSVICQLHGDGRLPTRAAELLGAASGADSVPLEPAEAADGVFTVGDFADAVAHVGAQLADALAYLHERGVRHQDLKPANVLLTPAGKPLLLDFNLASSQEAVVSNLGGTLPYMAPEQLRALGAEGISPAEALDARADLFALGVLLYELLTGRHPFGLLPKGSEEKDLREHLLWCQRRGPAAVPAAAARNQPLVRLIEQCLAWNPDTRPASATQLAEALRKCQLPQVEAARRTARRRSALLVAGLAAGASLAAVSVILPSRLAGRTSTETPIGQPPDGRDSLAAGLQAYAQGEAARAIAELSAALAAEKDPRHRSWAYYARGRAYQSRGEFGPALADYQQAFALVPDWRLRACMGYCRSRLEDHERALEDYTWVIERRAGNAAIYNNRAWSTLQRGDTAELAQAAGDVRAALRLNPVLATPHATGIRVELQHLLAVVDRPPGLEPEDLAVALTVGPQCGAFYYDCLRLCAETARRKTEPADRGPWLELGIESAARAVQTNAPPWCFKNPRVLEQLGTHPRFQALVERLPDRAQAGPGKPPERLLDPVADAGPRIEAPQPTDAQ